MQVLKEMTETERLHKRFLKDFTKLLKDYNADYSFLDDRAIVFFNLDNQSKGSYLTLPLDIPKR